MTKKQLIFLGSLLAVALITPFLAGYWLSGPEHLFGGFLLNPSDGNSYLAKMHIGWQGEWRFQLPYTAETGEGAYLFLFYIFLGHIARITTLPLAIVFHLARLIASGFLVYSLLRFLRRLVRSEDQEALGLVMGLLLFGSGLGWIAVLFGVFTSDFWVAEAFPFLSMFANPHFPLGLGLLLAFFERLLAGVALNKAYWLFPLGMLTAVIQPFAVVVSAIVAGVYVLWEWIENRKLVYLPAALYVIGGGLFLGYQYAAILSDPLLAGWNAQNLTPSPPFWDVIVSFSPVLGLAVVGLVVLIRRRGAAQYKLVIIWLVAGLGLVYAPFALQRRFLLGYFIPCAVLAGPGLIWLTRERIRLRQWLSGVIIILSLITNLFVIISGINGILSREQILFISKDEQRAFEWMNSPEGTPGLILASDTSGMFIPAYTAYRVIYGHPFETVDAQLRRKEVNGIFASWGQAQIDKYVIEKKVEFIFWGPREQMSRNDNPFLRYNIAYQNQTVTIFRTGEGQ